MRINPPAVKMAGGFLCVIGRIDGSLLERE